MITFGDIGNRYSFDTSANFSFTTTYTEVFLNPPQSGQFSFVDAVVDNNGSWYTAAQDHTINDENGFMFLVNADYTGGQLYNSTVNNLCIGLQYEFSAYLANVCKTKYLIQPNVRFEVRSSTVGNQLLAQLNSGNIPNYDSMTWKKYGLSFIAPNSSVVLLMISDAASGDGNDLAIDDIALHVCSLNSNGICHS